MKVATVREFRDRASEMFKSKDPVVVTRHGKIAGIFFPSPIKSLPRELKKELFTLMTDEIAQQLREAGMSEEDVLEDFEEWKKKRRASRS